jgi:hypothetical protein
MMNPAPPLVVLAVTEGESVLPDAVFVQLSGVVTEKIVSDKIEHAACWH